MAVGGSGDIFGGWGDEDLEFFARRMGDGRFYGSDSGVSVGGVAVVGDDLGDLSAVVGGDGGGGVIFSFDGLGSGGGGLGDERGIFGGGGECLVAGADYWVWLFWGEFGADRA